MPVSHAPLIPVILSGGTGSRLWPVSREDHPKPFMKIGADMSLLAQTVRRAHHCTEAQAPEIFIVTQEQFRQKTLNEVADTPARIHILGEPMPRNTAAAIAYAACRIKKLYGGNCIMWILPADHHVGDETALTLALYEACAIASQGSITAFGITPDRPDTAYGYIKTGAFLSGCDNARQIESFTEKPDTVRAALYLSEGGYLWNSGMFVCTADTVLAAFTRHASPLLSPIKAYLIETKTPDIIPAAIYNGLPSLPFDIAIMEKIDNGAVVACDLAWSDVGSWNSIWQIRARNDDGNALSGQVACIDSKDCLIESNALLIAAIGLEDVAIVEHGNAVLVADKKNPAAMHALAHALKQSAPSTEKCAAGTQRPWGFIRVLSEARGHKINEVTIQPEHKQSLHSHSQRCEFITLVSGMARITLNGTVHSLQPKDHLFIPLMARHRIENIGPDDLVLIEVQVGEIMNDDDTRRYDDIYGRAIEIDGAIHAVSA